MTIIEFAQNKNLQEEVFSYITKHAEDYCLRQLKDGKDVIGMKNAFDILREAQAKMISEFTVKRESQRKDRAV